MILDCISCVADYHADNDERVSYCPIIERYINRRVHCDKNGWAKARTQVETLPSKEEVPWRCPL